MEAGKAVTVRLTRSSASHGGAPQWLGVEVDDVGQARSWQNAGGSVGRFARALLPKERTALTRAISSAKKAVAAGGESDATEHLWKPDGSTEQLSAGGLPELEFDPHEDPPKGFGSLLRVLRTLMGDLVDSPVAALALEVRGDPLKARLRHMGSEAVQVRLGALSVESTLFDQDSTIIDRAALRVEGPSEAAEVGTGWVFELGDELGIAIPRKGQFLVVSTELESDADGQGVLRKARLSRMIE